MASRSINSSKLPSTSAGSRKLSTVAEMPSKNLKKPCDSENDCRRSKRFRSKVLNFWDFERISIRETDEGSKAAVIKDIPGEGTIILQDQDSAEEDGASSSSLLNKISKHSHVNETKSSKRISQPKSTNSVSKASFKKSAFSSERSNLHKTIMTASSKASDNMKSKGHCESFSKGSPLQKQSQCKAPSSSLPTSMSGVVPRRSRRCQPQNLNNLQGDDRLSEAEVAENYPPASENLESPQEQSCESPVPSKRKKGEKIHDQGSSAETFISSYRKTPSESVLKAKHMNNGSILDSQLPLKMSGHKLRTKASPKNKSRKSQPFSSLQSSDEESPFVESTQLPMETNDTPVRGNNALSEGKDLVFYGFSQPSNPVPATGEYVFAKGGAHEAVETFFLHLTKGYIAFNAPKDMKVFVVRGCGHCSQVVEGAPSVLSVLFNGVETNVQKGATLMLSVDRNCPELIICLLLYTCTQPPRRI